LPTLDDIVSAFAIETLAVGHDASYTASAGDVLSIRYSKNPGAIYNIYSAIYSTNLFLMEVDK